MVQSSRLELVREWDWLHERLSPVTEAGGGEAIRVCSVGSAEDAVVVTGVLWRKTESDLRTYLAGWKPDPPAVSFSSTAIRSVPVVDRDACFERKQRRWVPQPAVAGQVVVGEPQGWVDLLTWREPEDRNGAGLDRAATWVRQGGHVLLAEAPETVPESFSPVGSDGRLYRKNTADTPETASRPDGLSPDTLARLQFQQDLIDQHVNLARSLARRFLHRGEPADDLQQVAFLALIKAARRFDPAQQTAFSTFATVSILGELKRHFRDKTWMLRVPRTAQELYLTIKSAREELGHQLGRSPTIAELSVHLGVGEDAVLEAMEAGETYWPRSLDLRGEGGERIIDPPVEDIGLDLAVDREQLRAALPALDAREHLVFKRIFFDEDTQKKVADEIGVSQMQVSRILARALVKARKEMTVSVTD